MSILKRLIIREWIKFFLSAVMLLLVLVTSGDLISGLLRGNVTALEVLGNNLINLPSKLSQIFPVSCLIASMFSINKLKNRNELTAIFASGFGRKSYIITTIQISVLIAIMQFFINGYVQPFAKSHRDLLITDSQMKFKNLKGAGLRASTAGSGKLWYKSKDYFFSFSAFDKSKNILHDIAIYLLDEKYKLKKKIFAQKAIHQKDFNWQLHQGISYGKLHLPEFPDSVRFKTRSITLHEQPSDLGKIEADITTLDIVHLWDYISKLKKSGINTSEYDVLFWNTFASSLICILFAMLSSIAIFNPNRRGSSFGKSIAFVFVFTIIYWFVFSYTVELGKSSIIHPIVACFIVPALFALFLVYYFFRHRVLR